MNGRRPRSGSSPWIALVRHGPPDAERSAWLPGVDLPGWWASYDEASVRPDSTPPSAVRRLAAEAAVVASSPLPRARTSAERLVDGEEIHVLDDARELGSWRPRCRMRLPVRLWSVIARLRWWLGASGPQESRGEAGARVRRLADEVEALADAHGSVLLIAHGMLNHALGRELRARGWRGPRLPAPGHWSAARFRRPR